MRPRKPSPPAPWLIVLPHVLDLGREDPAAEVLAAYPEAKADEAKAAEWASCWTCNWHRRFGQ